MRIAILAWGSLVWDPGDLKIEGNWLKGGPELPIELSRLSTNRGFLTYVIDERHVRRVPTEFAISRNDNLEDAIADLACREGCRAHSIGFVEASAHGGHRSRTQLCWDIQAWVKEKDFDAVIWTDLPPQLPRGVSYEGLFDLFKKLMAELPADQVAEAKTYASKAPAEVDTDLRRRLVQEGLIPAAKPG